MARTTIPGAQDAGLAAFQWENFGGPAELFSGDTPVSTTTENVGQNSNIPAFSVVGRAGNAPGGNLVLANFVGAEIGDAGGAYASGAGTFSGVGTAGDTITLGTVVYTLVAAPAVANDVKIGGTAAATAANFADAINASAAAITAGTVGPGTVPNPDANATVAGAVVTARANLPGAAGNSLASTDAGTGFSWAATTLLGGTDIAGGGITPIGITTVNVLTGSGVVTTVDVFRSGMFNPDALNWDASFNTDAKRKAAFEGSISPNIFILKPKYAAYDVLV